MKKIFEVQSDSDKKLSEVVFSDDNNSGYFSMEIVCKLTEQSNSLKGDLISLKRVFDMDEGDQGFAIEQQSRILRLTGNIANALHICVAGGFISEELKNQFDHDSEVKDFLERSKTVSSMDEVKQGKEIKNKKPSMKFGLSNSVPHKIKNKSDNKTRDECIPKKNKT